MNPRTLLACLTSLLTLVGLTTAQRLGTRHVTRPTPLELRLDPRSYWQNQFTVKFREGFRVRIAEAAKHGGTPGPTRAVQLQSPDGLDLSAVVQLLGNSRRIEPIFTRPVADLDRERVQLAANAHPEDTPADLANYYRVHTSGRIETLRLLNALLAQPVVETAYPVFHPGAMVPAQTFKLSNTDPSRGGKKNPKYKTPMFESRQGYLGDAPGALGFLDVCGIAGAQGHPAQKIVQIEAAWQMGHEDLPQLTRRRIIGLKAFYWFDTEIWRDHGMASVGILNAARDDKGIRGFVPNSQLWVCSIINKQGNAVSLATAVSKLGDIFSSSIVQATYYQNKGYHAPFDYLQEVYDAIRTARLKGILIAIAAGNSGVSLEDTNLYGTRYLPKSTPSGALIVGATKPLKNAAATWCNHGSVVLSSGWGEEVCTTGYGVLWKAPESPGRRYTATFGGTSGATPQVAGALASIQAASLYHFRAPVAANTLLSTLAKHGTKITGGVGPRPNLPAMYAAIGLIGGLSQVGETRPGEAITLGIALQPKDTFILFGDLTNSWLPLPGFKFPLLLNPATMVFITAGVMPQQSPVIHKIFLPKAEILYGKHLYYQAFRLDPTMNLDMTNGIDAWLRLRPNRT